MARYLLERFLPTATEGAPASLGDAALAACAGVRLLQTIYVPDDEVCFYLLESDSLELVRQASSDAGLPFDRVHVVQTGGDGPTENRSLTDDQALALARRSPREADLPPP